MPHNIDPPWTPPLSDKYLKYVYFINTREMLWNEAYVFAQTEDLPLSREGRAAKKDSREGLKGGSQLTHSFLLAGMVPEVGHCKDPAGTF